MPWLILSVVVAIWGTGAFKSLVNPIFTWNYPIEGLHNMVQKVPPVVAKSRRRSARSSPSRTCPTRALAS